MWLGFILQKREQITANFHDEIILEIKKGEEENVKELLEKAVQKVNSMLKLNRDLEIDMQFGSDYSKIH
mgnify:FL=1